MIGLILTSLLSGNLSLIPTRYVGLYSSSQLFFCAPSSQLVFILFDLTRQARLKCFGLVLILANRFCLA